MGAFYDTLITLRGVLGAGALAVWICIGAPQASAQSLQNISTSPDQENSAPLGSETWEASAASSYAVSRYKKGDYETALSFFEKAYAADPDNPTHLAEAGRSALMAGQWDKGAVHLNLYISKVEETRGPLSTQLSGALTFVGQLYASLKRPDLGAPHLKRAVSIDEQRPTANSLQMANNRFRLATTLERQRLYDEAEGHYLKTLALMDYDRNGRGEQEGLYAKALNHLGRLYQVTGRDGMALAAYDKALAASTTVTGPNSPQTAEIMTHLGALYLRLGRVDEAKDLIMKSLVIFESSLGDEDVQVGRTLGLLSSAYLRKGYLKAAERHGRRGLAIVERSLGETNQETQFLAKNLAQVLTAMGRPTDADATRVKYGVM